MEHLDAIVSEGEFECKFVGRLLPPDEKDAFLLRAPSYVMLDDDVYDLKIQQFSKFNAWEEKEVQVGRDHDLLKASDLPDKYSYHRNVRDIIYHFILNDQKKTNEFVDQLLVLSPDIEVYDHSLGANEIYGVMSGKAVCLMLKPFVPPPPTTTTPLPPMPPGSDPSPGPDPDQEPGTESEPITGPEPKPDGCLGCFTGPAAGTGCFGVPLVGCFDGCLASVLFRLIAFLIALISVLYLLAILYGLFSIESPVVYEVPTDQETEASSNTKASTRVEPESSIVDQDMWDESILLAEPVVVNRSSMALDLGFVMVYVWDSDIPDADTVDVYFNDILVASNVELRRERTLIRVSNYVLDEINTMTIYTKSQGRMGLASIGYSFCAECEIIDGVCKSSDFVGAMQAGQTVIHHLFIRDEKACPLKEVDPIPNE